MNKLEFKTPPKGSAVKSVSEKYICSGCYKQVEDIEHEDGYKWKYGCECNLNDQAKKSNDHNQTIKHERYFRKSLQFIPPNFQSVKFSDYKPENKVNERSLKICERYANNFDIYNKQSLFLHGSYGLGKSMLSACIMNAVKQKYKVMYIDVNALLTNISMSWNANSELSKQNYQETMFKYIRTADLVIFDDIGSSAKHSTQISLLLTLIQSRLGKHNIYTTNLTQKELSQDKDWERIFSRMMENTTPLEFTGEDHRRKGKFAPQSSEEEKAPKQIVYDIDNPPF